MDYQYITDESGVPISVVIPISEWTLIQKRLQEKSDKTEIKNIKKDIQLLVQKYQSVKPFETISDPSEWQKGIRDEW